MYNNFKPSNMKKYTNRIVGMAILMLTIGCALESKFGLPNDEAIQTELIGKWKLTENGKEEVYEILKKDDNSYRLVAPFVDGGKDLMAYTKTIKGHTILTVIQEEYGIVSNTFYGIHITKDLLVVHAVNKKNRTQDFGSEAELLQFFQENITNEDFFVDPLDFIRMKSNE
tara:strand:+ start:36564 stop:37073 length:510 start_codon:yes stop_codon:yes gene_type:complete